MLLETAFICLALNTYHEAKNQSLVGQIATAQVVMNRVEDNRFPNTICEVVKEGPTRPSCCLLYTSPSPRDVSLSRMPSSA